MNEEQLTQPGELTANPVEPPPTFILAGMEGKPADEIYPASTSPTTFQEENLRAQLEAVVQQLPVGVIVAEATSGKLLLGNQKVSEIWRHSFLVAEDVAHYQAYKGFHPEDGRPYAPEEWPLARTLATGEAVNEEEIDFLRGDGTSGTMLVSASPVKDPNGQTIAGVVTFLDVTKRKQFAANQQFLAQASELLASSLDYDTLLHHLAALPVPYLADWCTVDLIKLQSPTEGGIELDLERRAVAHSDPAKTAQAQALLKLYPPRPESIGGVIEVIRRGQAALVANLAEVELADHAHNSAHLEILKASGVHSYLVVPLIARGHSLGAISLMFAETKRHYGPEELELATELARRVGLALDNARLYRVAELARQKAEENAARLDRLHRVMSGLATASTTSQVAQIILEEGLPTLGANRGTVVLLSQEGEGKVEKKLQIVAEKGYEALPVERWRTIGLADTTPHSDAVKTCQPVLVSSRAELASRYPSLIAEFDEFGYGALASLPLVIEGRAIGAIGLGFSRPQSFSLTQTEFMVTLAGQCAQALERVRLYEAEKANQARQAFLAEATTILTRSLDYETCLKTLARLVVPKIADWCSIDMAEEVKGGSPRLRQLIISHVDPAKEKLVYELRERLLPGLDEENPVLKAFLTGQSELIPQIPEELIDLVSEDLRVRELLRELKLKSGMYVPIRSRGQSLGVMVLNTAESGRLLGEAEVALAEELARRAASAIENAQLYRTAQQAIQERDVFLSVAAHELKTPLTSLKGYTQLLARQLKQGQLPSVSRLERVVEVVAQQSDKLGKLVEQLLDVSRLEAGKLRLSLEQVDVRTLVAGVVEETQARSEIHSLNLQAPEQPLIAELDPLRFEQVVTNLLNNALKYSPSGGSVVVELSQPNTQEFRLSVTDWGLGIRVEQREHIFERFYQAHQKSYLGGMGLGLYITRQIIELHGGQIRAEFPEEGGTRFIISLPKTQA